MKHFARVLVTSLTLFAATSAMAATQTAMFAGGCFWCMQYAFDRTKGVTSTLVGYSGGEAKTATYEQVSSGTTGHSETIQVTYDPAQTKYEALVETYLENIDPTDPNGQFADQGTQYMPAIFYADDAQKKAAEKALAAIAPKFNKPIVVKVKPAKPFYAAEEHHQKYYQKNPDHFQAYEQGSGRADFIERTWGKK
jgi:methionine-S-sulfoxide reductase